VKLGAPQNLIPILTIGLSEYAGSVIAKSFSTEATQVLGYDVEKIMEANFQPPPAMLAIGTPPEGLSLSEVAQMLRAQFASVPIFYTTTIRTGFDKATLTNCRLLQMDRSSLIKR
jgi:hypothetical protein